MTDDKGKELPSRLVVGVKLDDGIVEVMAEVGGDRRELRALELDPWEVLAFGRLPGVVICRLGEYHLVGPTQAYAVSRLSVREDGLVPPVLRGDYELVKKTPAA